MTQLLNYFIIIPLLAYLISLIVPRKNEALMSKVAFISTGLHLISFITFFILWMSKGHPTLNLKDLIIYKSADYEFSIDFFFDKITAVYLFVGASLAFMVTIYSRYYLHREHGYKRFFNTVLLFYLGYNITIFAGNLETLFLGWEILGISSFLLIAFYRDRYLPVKNAVKVFSIYRIGDVGLILAMWMSHHLFHENITFIKLYNYELVHEHLQSHTVVGVFISLMILLSAAAKSAQLPFSSWLPRAMEGPTPSTAIFYGSLSVHIGVFLLLRTYPFWEQQTSVRIIIALLGLITAIITTLIARVQSSVKSQIAYGSISQIGLIFIEVAAGFENLALLHFAGNAFLRTYQLLVSPSVVSYLIREQFFSFTPRQKTIEDSFPKRIEYSVYLLSLKEWNLESFIYKSLWSPFKKIGKKLNFINESRLFYFFIPLYALGIISWFSEEYIPTSIHNILPSLFSIIGVLMVVKSYTERKNVFVSWLLIIMNHFWIALAISFNEHFEFKETILYLSGISFGGLIGYLILKWLKKTEQFDLNQYHGHVYEHPRLTLFFLLACLSLAGFPITPTFVGEDLIFSHIHENQILLACVTSFSFILAGLSLIRIFSRVFLGPHLKTYHEVAYKSS